jgi:glycosyltransferase involved in cell wall biosynthesis
MRDGITVIIPVYNGAKYLSECIQSVAGQTRPAAEIIVIDDGSEDATPDVAASWGSQVRYCRVAHGGLPYARNHGLRLATTDIIAFIDSDDIWLPHKLELQMAVLSREAGPAMVFGHVEQFVSSDLTADEAAKFEFTATPLAGWFSSTLLIGKRDCESAGPFDETIQTGEFIEWCSRARDIGITPVVIQDLVCRRRIHDSNLGRGGRAQHAGYARMLKKVLDRRRQQA